MARTQQDILVKIKVLLEGLGNVRALAGHVKELSTGGGGKTAALAGDIDKLSAAVDRLAASQEKASSKGGFVRFLVGLNAVITGLATLPQAFAGLEKLLDFLDNVGGGIGKAFGFVKSSLSSLFSALSQFAGGVAAQVGPAVTGLAEGAAGLGGVVAGLGAAFVAALPVLLAVGAALAVVGTAFAAAAAAALGLVAAAGLGALALTKIAPAGIAANSQLEQVRLGIAAVITSLALLNAGGVRLEGAQKFTAAMALAREQVAKLRVDAINTTATFEQIAPAFQAAIAPGLAARLNLDQIREITVKVVQAAGAIGLPLDQVNQEVRAILEGTINEDARLAKVLGISNKMVASWKAQGTLADELNKRLEGFATAGEEAAQTLEGLESNLQEALNVFSQEATTRAFAALKDEFKRLLPQLFDFKNAGIQGQFKVLADLADDVLVRVIRLGGEIAQSVVSGLRRAADFVSQNRALINDVLGLVGIVARQLLSIVGIFVRVGANTSVWRGVLEGVRGVLMLISAILGTIESSLRDIAPLLQVAAMAAVAVMMSNSTLAAASRGAGAKTSQQVAAETAEQAGGLLDSLRGSLTTVSPGTPAAAGGGKKGGGGRKSKVPELQRGLDRATVDADLAAAQARFESIKQDIEASIDGVKNGLDDAILSISEAYRLEAALADKALKNEQDRIDAEIKAAKARRDLAVKDLDPDLKPEERRLAIAAEDKKLLAETARLEGERKRLVEATEDKKAGLVRDEAKANKQLQQTLADIENQLDSMSGSAAVRADAAAREIEARFEETRRQLVANFGEASAEVQRLDDLIKQLTERATFHELTTNVETKFGELRDIEELLSVGVESGQIRAWDALKRRLELEREYKRVLLDEINGLAEIARRTGDPELLAAVRKLQIEWAKLGVTINETAKRIDDTIRGGLEDTLANIITRTETVGEAFRKLAQTILAEIARILAVNFVDKLFGGIPNTNAQGTSLGGILAKILGAGTPKTSGTPAPAGGGIENLPLIIKNLTSSTGGKLDGVKGNTAETVNELRGGFGRVGAGFNQLLSFLPNLLPASPSLLGQALSAAVGAVAGNLSAALTKKLESDNEGPSQPRPTKPPVLKRALGGLINGPGTGTSDSILARVSKGEFVLREWATRRIGVPALEYMNRLGAVPDVPRFALGGVVGGIASINPPESIGGDTFNLTMSNRYEVKDGKLTPQSRAAMERDAARITKRGVQRSVASRK